jgi:hypothetical protein
MTPSDPTKLQFHYVLTCPCSETLTGDTEDEIVQASLATGPPGGREPLTG